MAEKIIIEIRKTNEKLTDAIKLQLLCEYEIVEIKSLVGADLTQIIIPLAALVVPSVTQILLKLIKDEKVTIKKDKIEITAKNLETAIEAYRLIQGNQGENDDN